MSNIVTPSPACGGSTAKRGWGERNTLALVLLGSPLRALRAHLPRKQGRSL